MGRKLLPVLYLLFIASFLYPQEMNQGGAQYYVYPGGEGELQIKVQIWGQVIRPGIYQVPKSMDVVGLISLAGGPSEDANLSAVKIVRTTPAPDVLKANIGRYIGTASTESTPLLEAGDTVIVPENLYHKFSRVVSVVAQLAIVANVYYWFFGRK
jgi:hypothetical protein